MNRIALHLSSAGAPDPVALVAVAAAAGVDSVGLHVAGVEPAPPWWERGIGSPMLTELAEALLRTRVTVLDVGRVVLGPELRRFDAGHGYARVLELGLRLGAQFVTCRAAPGGTGVTELFGLLAELAARYRMRALLTVVAGTPVDTPARAQEVVAPTGGGIVLDVSPRSDAPEAVDETIVELGDALGYVRLPAAELPEPQAAGMLATLPPHVPVAIGGGPSAAASAGPGYDDAVARAAALRAGVDTLLRHPRAARPVTPL